MIFEELLILHLIYKILKIDAKIAGFLLLKNIEILIIFYQKTENKNSKEILQNILQILELEGENSDILAEHLKKVKFVFNNQIKLNKLIHIAKNAIE